MQIVLSAICIMSVAIAVKIQTLSGYYFKLNLVW